MIAVDTNILIYSHRVDSPFHRKAFEKLSDLSETGSSWAIPWPCIHEFFGIVTHPHIFSPPSTRQTAIEQVESWLFSPSLRLLGEQGDHWIILKKLIVAGEIMGPKVHDLRIAAICIAHGVDLLWSADRDYNRIAGLKVINPLI